MAQRLKAKNPAHWGQELILRGGAARLDAWGFVPMDVSPEQLEHAKASGLFEVVEVTRASVLKEELERVRHKLAEVRPSTEQAQRILRQWVDRQEALEHDEAALAGELAALEAVAGPEPEPAAPTPHIDLEGLDWEGLKAQARAHGVTIAGRTRETIKAELAAKLAPSPDTKES